MRPKFKDVPVADAQYRIGRLTAADGSWIAMLLTEKLRESREAAAASVLATPTTATPADPNAPPAPSMSIDDGMMMTATFLITKLSRTELADVQLMCMHAASKLEMIGESLQPMPLIVNGNQWADADMEYDGPTVLEVTKQVLAFNIVRFFLGAG